LIDRHRLTFDLLRDPGNGYADSLGLCYTCPDYLKEIYLGFDLDLAKHNGEDSWRLPMPGRFVIDTHGIIRAVDASPDYTRRPEPQKILDDVAALVRG
jgi:peroxiredoxin